MATFNSNYLTWRGMQLSVFLSPIDGGLGGANKICLTFDPQPPINWGLEKVAHDVNLTHLATDAITNCKTLEGLDAHTVQIPNLGAKFIYFPPFF